MPDPTPDFAARRRRAVLLVVTVAVIAYFAFTGRSDGSAELSVSSGEASAPETSADTTVSVQATVAAAPSTTTAPPATVAPATTAAGSDPLVFRKPLNGTVNVTLKW